MILAIVLFGFFVFSASVYAIHKGYGVKTAMKWLGATFTFEAEKKE